MAKNFRSGYVTLVGAPNVGKSTLLNRLLGQKIAIVSPRPQTTRDRILGILTEENFQIVFLDTPGIFRPEYALQRAMVETATRTLAEADLALMMAEGKRELSSGEERIIDLIKDSGVKAVLALNKIDLIREKKEILPLIAAYDRRGVFKEIVPISALRGNGVDELLRAVVDQLPEGPQYYPEDMITESPERFLAAEVVREKLFLRTGEEIPYSTAVKVDEYKDRGAVLYIKATIYVERDSQKAIVIGEKGRKLKEIGKIAREELQGSIGKKIFLDLWVKVRRKWRHNESDLRFFGYRGRR